jgi:hypothetical protein
MNYPNDLHAIRSKPPSRAPLGAPRPTGSIDQAPAAAARGRIDSSA